ncbi:hypothetical protein M5E87_05680 [Flavonifractor plautii]|nr:hypothetical protein M5E87_05680 [Flavonifractor plautii]
MSKKKNSPLPLTGEKAILERRYQEDGSRSITAFIERAVDFTWTISAPTMPDCFSPPPSSPMWMDGWDSWRIGWPLCCTSKQWSRTWW